MIGDTVISCYTREFNTTRKSWIAFYIVIIVFFVTDKFKINATDYIKGAIALQDNEDSEQYTHLTLNIKDRFPLDFDFRFDNQGRSSVGLNRFVIFAGMKNLTGFGDQLLSTTSFAYPYDGCSCIVINQVLPTVDFYFA